MKKLLCLIILPSLLFAQDNLIQNVYHREKTSLNGKWDYIVDPYKVGYYDYRLEPFDKHGSKDGFYSDDLPKDKSDRIEYNFETSDKIYVPGDWNSQKEKLFYYEGAIWYRRVFNVSKEDKKRYYIHFGAVNYESHVYLNGKKLGGHIGGFTPFNFEATDYIEEGKNTLILMVDNTRKRDAVPTINTDWWNYGGITREVSLLTLSQTFIEDYYLQLKKGDSKTLLFKAQLNGSALSQKVSLSIPELKINQSAITNSEGKLEIEIPLKKYTPWSPENPKQYDVDIKIDGESVHDKIGFRSLEVLGADILVNGKSQFLRGICIHEENPIRGGRAWSREDSKLLLGWAKELNCNFVRLAHYPHNENMVRLAEEMGIMVWEENPVYWTIDWTNKETLQNAGNQLSEIMQRDKNRASVIVWSMANETPVNESRTSFLATMAKQAKAADNTRLISAALEKHPDPKNPLTLIVEDPFIEYVDILSFNEYVGWYDGLPEKCDKVKWQINYNKPVIISEFGGGALQGYRGDSLTRWTEDYQNYMYNKTINMLNEIPQLRGMTPWILADFRSPRRNLPIIQDGWNRKGVVSEKGIKKLAFRTLSEYYQNKKTNFK